MDKNINYINEWEKLFVQYKSYLISFAFRMTGSLSEAEDIVQDVFIECSHVNPSNIKNHKAWLIKVCSNKGIDLLKSAHKKRETYPGVWLPDTIPDSFQIFDYIKENDTPEKNLLLSESLTISFLLLIEKLTPEERVIYLLSEIFDYSFREISEFLNKSEATCRKIAQRARDSIFSHRLKFDQPSANAKKLIVKFFESAKKGDKSALMDFLSADSELWADGGGKVPVASNTVLKGADKIANFFKLLGTSTNFDSHDLKLEFSQVNSRPGLIISKRLPSGLWSFETILSFEIKNDGQIVRIYAQRNPDKLKNLNL